jgi:hypothetical protein
VARNGARHQTQRLVFGATSLLALLDTGVGLSDGAFELAAFDRQLGPRLTEPKLPQPFVPSRRARSVRLCSREKRVSASGIVAAGYREQQVDASADRGRHEREAQRKVARLDLQRLRAFEVEHREMHPGLHRHGPNHGGKDGVLATELASFLEHSVGFVVATDGAERKAVVRQAVDRHLAIAEAPCAFGCPHARRQSFFCAARKVERKWTVIHRAAPAPAAARDGGCIYVDCAIQIAVGL